MKGLSLWYLLVHNYFITSPTMGKNKGKNKKYYGSQRWDFALAKKKKNPLDHYINHVVARVEDFTIVMSLREDEDETKIVTIINEKTKKHQNEINVSAVLGDPPCSCGKGWRIWYGECHRCTVGDRNIEYIPVFGDCYMSTLKKGDIVKGIFYEKL